MRRSQTNQRIPETYTDAIKLAQCDDLTEDEARTLGEYLAQTNHGHTNPWERNRQLLDADMHRGRDDR
jgi:hypothetical protein